MKKNIFILSVVVLLAVMVCSCGGSATKEAKSKDKCEITGAGARVPEPFYLMAFDAYTTSKGNPVKYEDIGSLNGIQKLQKKSIDFAGSDEFVGNEETAKMQEVVQIPTCLVAVVFSYNLPGVKDLKLSGNVVAGIYTGKIRRWNDGRIKALNPRVKLPAEEIIPIYRSDASCINFLLTTFLSDTNDKWKTKYGAAKTVKFPVGHAANCNADVATKLEETPYSIGYLGSEYALTLKLPVARLQNINGEFVKPSVKSVSAAASGEIPADTCAMLVNSPVKGAYPMSYFTWLIVYKEQKYNNRTKKQARATVELLQYMLSEETQQATKDINFAPLPKSMIENSQRKLRKITYNGKPILRQIIYR